MGIVRARLLEWVALPFSRESSRPRDRACVHSTGRDSLPLSHLGSRKNPVPALTHSLSHSATTEAACVTAALLGTFKTLRQHSVKLGAGNQCSARPGPTWPRDAENLLCLGLWCDGHQPTGRLESFCSLSVTSPVLNHAVSYI